MDILVFSDSHGRKEYVPFVISREAGCKTVFFLGDGEDDVLPHRASYPDRQFFCVKGNCESYSHLPKDFIKFVGGVTIYACHGDAFAVKNSLSHLFSYAASVEAELVLYGHTHEPAVTYDEKTGVCAVNPGTLSAGQYCVISVNDGKLDIVHKEI